MHFYNYLILMEFLTKIKDKIDSTKEYLANKFIDSTIDSKQPIEGIRIDKKINFNQIEFKKVLFLICQMLKI